MYESVDRMVLDYRMVYLCKDCPLELEHTMMIASEDAKS